MQVFNFNRKTGTPVRVQVINDEPWFVAKDVCHILGISNHIDAVSRLDEDEKAEFDSIEVRSEALNVAGQ